MTINLSPKQQAELHSRLHYTFKSYLCNYEEDWLYSILPSIVVAGGAVPAMLQDEAPNDFDVYFTNEDSFRKAFRYVSSDIQVSNDLEIKELKLGKLRKTTFDKNIIKTNNAITFPNKVQVVTRFIGDPLTLFETFDFEHCKCYWKPSIREKNSGTLHFEGQSLESLLKKQLIYTGKSRFVISAMKRHEKFISRGWKTNDLTRLKLMHNSSKLDWENPEVIMEQLQGYYGEDRKACEEFLKQFQNPLIKKKK